MLEQAGKQDDDAELRELAAARRERDVADQLTAAEFQALEASAHFDRVLYDGAEFGVSAEEEEFLGLPGLLPPDQVAVLLRNRKAALPVPAQAAAGPATATARETLAALRKELNGLVAAWHHRTGQQHGAIHAELRRACGGAALGQASAEQIRSRIEMMRKWAWTRQ